MFANAVNQGNAKLVLDRYEEAIKDYDVAIRLNPKAASVFYNRGIAKRKLGRHEEAIKDYDIAIQLNPKNAIAFDERGIAKTELGDYEEAIKDYDVAIRLNPKAASVFYNRGAAKADLGHYEEAIKDYDVAIQLNPKSAFAFDERGIAKFKLGHYEEAIKDYDVAIQLNPKAASVFYERGVAKADLGHYEEAIKDYDAAIQLNPKEVIAFNWRGLAKRKLGRYEEAIKDYDAAIQLNPKEASAFHVRGLAKLELGHYEEAIKDYDIVIQLNPKEASAFYSRGVAKADLGHYEEAIKDYDVTIQLNPNEAIAFYSRGLAKAGLGHYEEAIKDYDVTIQLNPNEDIVFIYRGLAYLYLNQIDHALQAFNQTLRLNIRSVHGYVMRSLMALLQNDPRQATEYIQQATQLEAKSPWVFVGQALIARYGLAQDDLMAQQSLSEFFELYTLPANRDKIHQKQSLYFLYGWIAQLLHDLPIAITVYEAILSTSRYRPAELALQQAKDQLAQQDNAVLKKAAEAYVLFSNSDAQSPSQEKEQYLVNAIGQLSLSIAIPYNELTFGQKLGEGGFGVVYKGEYQYSPVAIKQLLNQQLSNALLEEFQRETSIMARLRSSYIVQFYGACFENPHYSLVMEYMANGSLYSYLQKPGDITWETRYQMGVDISCGMAYLHKQGVIHGDLKSLNILLDQHLHAKITDFGLAKVKLDSAVSTVLGANVGGSLPWMAPELLDEGAKNTKASDVHSFGMVLWELGTRQVPFAKKATRPQQIMAFLFKGVKEEIHADTPPSMAKLISRCWESRAEQRPSMEEAVKVLREEQQQRFIKN